MFEIFNVLESPHQERSSVARPDLTSSKEAEMFIPKVVWIKLYFSHNRDMIQ